MIAAMIDNFIDENWWKSKKTSVQIIFAFIA